MVLSRLAEALVQPRETSQCSLLPGVRQIRPKGGTQSSSGGWLTL